jgi:hypothetical protein
MKILLTFFFLLISCSKKSNLKFSNSAVMINLQIESSPSQKDSSLFYYGNLIVKNLTADTIKYSNKDLILTSKSNVESRTYVDSPASHIVDFGTININPKSSFSTKSYWVFKEKVFSESLQLNYTARSYNKVFKPTL